MGTTYTHTDSDGDQIEVVTYPNDPAPTIIAKGQDRWAEVEFTKEDAPALALAILEAAGYTGDDDLSIDTPDGAVRVLRRHIQWEARQKAEAEEAQKLDEEALALVNAWRESSGSPTDGSLGPLKDNWRAVARMARELYGAQS